MSLIDKGCKRNEFSIKKTVYLILGIIMLIIAAFGIALPLLPATPFVLLASFFFANSSQRLHDWLSQTKFYRSNVQPLLDGKGMTIRSKLSILLLAWGLLAVMYLRTDVIALKILAVSLAAIKGIVFFKIKTARPEKVSADSAEPAAKGAATS